MRLSLLLFLAATYSACSPKIAGLNQGESNTESISTDDASAPFTIVSLRVEADSLVAELQYGGGFRTHEFALVSGGAATKSLPRQQPLNIIHDAQGDMGRALITSRHAFDLTPLRDPARDMVRLAVEGWPERINYPYIR